jgi:hypothetical protein
MSGLLCVLRVIKRRADPSSRGVLPTVKRHCVWSIYLKKEAVLACVGLLRQRHKIITLGKGKCHPTTCHEGSEVVEKNSSHFSLTSALDGGGRSRQRSGYFFPGNDSIPWVSQSGRVRKILPQPGFALQTAQPVATRNTNWTIPAHRMLGVTYILIYKRAARQPTHNNANHCALVSLNALEINTWHIRISPNRPWGPPCLLLNGAPLPPT